MENEPDKKRETGSFYKDIAPYIGLGTQLAVTVTIMVFLGVWLDSQFELKPVLTIIFSFLGVFAGLYTFIKQVLKSGK